MNLLTEHYKLAHNVSNRKSIPRCESLGSSYRADYKYQYDTEIQKPLWSIKTGMKSSAHQNWGIANSGIIKNILKQCKTFWAVFVWTETTELQYLRGGFMSTKQHE